MNIFVRVIGGCMNSLLFGIYVGLELLSHRVDLVTILGFQRAVPFYTLAGSIESFGQSTF